MSDEIRELTIEEMATKKMNDRQFAEYLTERMSKEGSNTLSHATVINWRKHGKAPSTEFLEDMLSVYPVSDRRFLFALRMLAVKSPHVWGSEGVVWRIQSLELVKAM
jgi:hypothetical protein